MRFWFPDTPQNVWYLPGRQYHDQFDAMGILLMSLCQDRDATDLFSGTEDSRSNLLDGYRRTLETQHHTDAIAQGYNMLDLDMFLGILSDAIRHGNGGLSWGPETEIRNPTIFGLGRNMRSPESAL